MTATDAERQADSFFANALPQFGDYEDAMLTGERFLWHSILSPYINSGLLYPLDLCRRAEAEYRKGLAALNSVEGYIRQIIGWRECMRGIYWREGPGYVDRNFLEHTRPLPSWYWTGDTQRPSRNVPAKLPSSGSASTRSALTEPTIVNVSPNC